MNRRPFLATLSGLGIGSLLSFKTNEASANSQSETIIEKYWEEADNYIPKVIKTLENDFISFKWYDDATAEIIDKKSNTNWKMGNVAFQEEESIERGHVWVRQERSMCEQYPARFRAELFAEGIKFTVLGFENKIKGTFQASVSLNNEFLEFSITNIAESLPNLMFPTPIESDQLVLPMGVGKLIRKPVPSRYFYSFFSHLNMRWFGGLKTNEKNGWMCIYEDNFENGGIMVAELSIIPTWQKSLGKWESTRSFKYCFTSNGYVGQAKKYRQWAESKGLVKKLTDKIKQTPSLANLVGGRLISIMAAWPAKRADLFDNKLRKKPENMSEIDGKTRVVTTFKQMPEVIKQLKDAGMKKGIFNIRGWIKGGYDHSHPDIFPPEQACGTTDELKKVCETTDFTVVLHDNYQDIYEHNPSFPKGVNRRANGEPLLGGYWASGQSYILNSQASIDYAKRNWEQLKTLNAKGYFVDTITAMQLYESFEQGNTQTRKQDLERKIELIKFFKSKGVIFGSEESADFGIPVVDWMENRHRRVAGESIPLWPLVFHDCVMNGRYTNDAFAWGKEDISELKKKSPYWLEDMLWGYFLIYWEHGDEDKKLQLNAMKYNLHVDEWFGKIATAELTNHEYLSTDFEVEKTTFSNGKSITINFSNQEKTINGVVFKPFEYQIQG